MIRLTTPCCGQPVDVKVVGDAPAAPRSVDLACPYCDETFSAVLIPIVGFRTPLNMN